VIRDREIIAARNPRRNPRRVQSRAESARSQGDSLAIDIDTTDFHPKDIVSDMELPSGKRSFAMTASQRSQSADPA
jgi:hypothetical protein